MKQQDYQSSFIADITPEEAFAGINDVRGWWAKNFEGSAQRLNDVFRVDFGKTWVTFQLSEFIPSQRVTWKVTDCYLHWINDKKEWNGTSVRFDISKEGSRTRITMTHIGLAPGAECYQDCENGWNEHFGESLLKLLTEHAGIPM